MGDFMCETPPIHPLSELLIVFDIVLRIAIQNWDAMISIHPDLAPSTLRILLDSSTGPENICCMMTSSNGNILRTTGPLWGESTGHRWIPLTMASEAELRGLLALRMNKRLSQQSRRQWFETTLRSLWRHCSGVMLNYICYYSGSRSTIWLPKYRRLIPNDRSPETS